MVIKITYLAVGLLLGQALAFEVASVKPTRDTEGIREFQIQPGGRLVIAGMSLKDLVRRAYLMSDAAQDESRVVGGAGWVSSDRFDILAKVDGDVGFDSLGRPLRLLAMLQTLLESRFKLKVRVETRETDVYDLVLAGNGASLRPGLRASALECPTFQQGIPRPPQDPVRWCGVRSGLEGNVVRVTAQGVTMGDVATNFGGLRSVGRPVRDKTGLNGRFDFTIEYAPALTNVAEGATVFTAIRDSLGLKLQSAKGPVAFVVIDSAERPTND